MTRQGFAAILVVTLLAHAIGMARTPLPAQDGLKFLRAVEAIREGPFIEAVRGLDQHPGYPIAVAATLPIVEVVSGSGSHAARVAAQLVSLLAFMTTAWPLHALTRRWFGPRAARWAAILWCLWPIGTGLGHDTLSDPLGALMFATAAWLGASALGEGLPRRAFGAGCLAGLGYWVRPEVAAVAAAVAVAAILSSRGSRRGRLGLAFVVMMSAAMPIATYAMIKGSLSEKLTVRLALGQAPASASVDRPSRLPAGLDDPRWDFAPKEESDRAAVGPIAALAAVPGRLLGAMGIVGGLLASIGIRRGGPISARLLTATYAAGFGALLMRHAWMHGYLSERHTLTLALLLTPWAGAGADLCVVAWRGRLRRFPAWRPALIGLLGLVALLPAKGEHPTRWGHLAAGEWLRRHAGPADAVLDTRGWARFVADRPGYDYWHVGQALSDDRLRYVVVGADELAASSPRAATLRAVLAHAAEPAEGFPDRRGGTGRDVWIYRYRRPDSWRGVAP